MKLRKSLRKLSAIIMVFAMLFGLMGPFSSSITAKAASNPVQMYSMDYFLSKYGSSGYYVYIQVDASSAANKKVYVHHSTYSQGWIDTEATFFTKLDDNTEIWRAYVLGIQTDEYAIKYVGDGQTYWDNNNGNNYTTNTVLGQANVKAVRSSYQSSSNYYIRAAVKNLAYNKVVKVRYTQDNWATYQDVDLSYYSSISGANEECWIATLNLDSEKMDDFQYCIYYEVNGQTYWDNNFGANYDRSFYRPY